MKEIIDLVLFALIISGLLFAMLYYAIKETEEAKTVPKVDFGTSSSSQ